MTETPKLYWEERAQQFAAEGKGLRAICSFGMPDIYNDCIDITQRAALRPYFSKDLLTGKRVLDVGCGIGRWSEIAARSAASTTGIDISQNMLNEAIRRAGDKNSDTKYLCHDIAKDQPLEECFDIIYCVTVLQHIDEQILDHALSGLSSMLAPGGKIIAMEVAPDRKTESCDTTVFQSRDFEFYKHKLTQHHMSITDQRGVDIVPVKQWLLPFYPKLPALLKKALLYTACIPALAIDLIFARYLPSSSWHRVMIIEHAQDRS